MNIQSERDIAYSTALNLGYQRFKVRNPRLAQSGETNQDNSRIATLEKELNECRVEHAEWKERYLLLSADFANFKRRTSKEQATWAQDAKATVLAELLGIVDNVDRALEHRVETTEEVQSWLQGFDMIQRSLHAFLKKSGVEEVSYETFDPHCHEALMEVESDQHQPGQIVTVLQKGYTLGDRVLRPARVSIAK